MSIKLIGAIIAVFAVMGLTLGSPSSDAISETLINVEHYATYTTDIDGTYHVYIKLTSEYDRVDLALSAALLVAGFNMYNNENVDHLNIDVFDYNDNVTSVSLSESEWGSIRHVMNEFSTATVRGLTREEFLAEHERYLEQLESAPANGTLTADEREYVVDFGKTVAANYIANGGELHLNHNTIYYDTADKQQFGFENGTVIGYITRFNSNPAITGPSAGDHPVYVVNDSVYVLVSNDVNSRGYIMVDYNINDNTVARLNVLPQYVNYTLSQFVIGNDVDPVFLG